MKRRQWTPEKKTKIVLEALSGRPLAEICTQYEISQALYYQWREQFLSNASRAFESSEHRREMDKLRRKTESLKGIIADLTLELKKSEEVGSW
jgi:transposase-like protein